MLVCLQTLLSFAACTLLLGTTAGQDDPLPGGDPAITRAELEHHVRFLASDELAGRGAFTPGTQRAARYLARALEAAGVAPAGEGGTFFQELDVRSCGLDSAPRLLCTMQEGRVVEGRLGVDFDLRLRGRARSTEVLVLRMFSAISQRRLPAQGDPRQAVYFQGTITERKEAFSELGIEDLEDWGLEVDVVGGRRGLEPGQPRDLPSPRILAPTVEEGCERVELRGELRRALEAREIDHVQLLVDEVQSPALEVNVVGRIPGAGTPERPELAQEVVILSAHYDHLGLRRPREKAGEEAAEKAGRDLVFNGADDDASGCATLLELAQALAAGPRPPRTLIVLFTTCEESGGHGSARYLARPPEPLERTVAVLNLEMLGRPDPLVGGSGQLWLTGYERSNLGPAWKERGLAISDDPRPDQRFFQRSDNYAFALRGIVAQSLSSFGLHEDYHQVSDEADTLDYAHLESAARVALAAAASLADGGLGPAWIEGQEPKAAGQQGAADAGQAAGMRRGPRPAEEREGDKEKDGR